jgi:hypothetical protein
MRAPRQSGPTSDERVITVAQNGGALEKKAAALLAARAGERIGRSVSVEPEAAENGHGAHLVVVGTPASSNRIRSAVESGTVPLRDGFSSDGFALHIDSEATLVAAADPRGVVHGVGRLLRESSFEAGRWMLPGPRTLVKEPEKRLRIAYLATHLGNWYCHAPDEDLHRYVHDLALWGYNGLATWLDFHDYRGFEDAAKMLDRLGKLESWAREVGLKVGRFAVANESFLGQAPPELCATGHLEGIGWETDLCPSKPEAREIILASRSEFLERVRETTVLDWLCLWPYDAGGCNCEECTPWPRTYLELSREIGEMAADPFPGIDIHVSAWGIGQRPGEDEAFFRELSESDPWFRTIVSGASELRRWLGSGHRPPDGFEIMLFPEISMFNDLPWGSRGANPGPRRFGGIEASAGDVQHSAGDLDGQPFAGHHRDRLEAPFGRTDSFNNSAARRCTASSVSSSRIRRRAALSSSRSADVNPGSSPRSINSCRRHV